MLKNFRTYEMAVEFHKEAEKTPVPSYLRDQWLRASSSIVLNLGEGYGKFSRKDKARIYQIAFGSLRECQSILDLNERAGGKVISMADALAASLYRLIQAMQK